MNLADVDTGMFDPPRSMAGSPDPLPDPDHRLVQTYVRSSFSASRTSRIELSRNSFGYFLVLAGQTLHQTLAAHPRR